MLFVLYFFDWWVLLDSLLWCFIAVRLLGWCRLCVFLSLLCLVACGVVIICCVFLCSMGVGFVGCFVCLFGVSLVMVRFVLLIVVLVICICCFLLLFSCFVVLDLPYALGLCVNSVVVITIVWFVLYVGYGFVVLVFGVLDCLLVGLVFGAFGLVCLLLLIVLETVRYEFVVC